VRVHVACDDTEVVIDSVQGPSADIHVDGWGRVRASGATKRLHACLMGFGNIGFDGSADHAHLVVRGHGYINVARVWGTLVRTCVGSGDVVVAHTPRWDAARRVV
jgi:hypothetical protein